MILEEKALLCRMCSENPIFILNLSSQQVLFSQLNCLERNILRGAQTVGCLGRYSDLNMR